MVERSRRLSSKRGAVAVGGLAGLALWDLRPALAKSVSAPKPIRGGLDTSFNPVPKDPLIHVLPPAIGFDMSTITDFNGVVRAAEIQGTARGSDAYELRLRRGRALHAGRVRRRGRPAEPRLLRLHMN
jgi:hypothetical protein